jgi:hypothetical protein
MWCWVMGHELRTNVEGLITQSISPIAYSLLNYYISSRTVILLALISSHCILTSNKSGGLISRRGSRGFRQICVLLHLYRKPCPADYNVTPFTSLEGLPFPAEEFDYVYV